jgi:proteasome accessory factor A
MLVLDCIEAGELPEPPRLRRPIQSLRAVCADTELGHCVETTHEPCTAIELQRFYCAACRRYLSRHGDAPLEAWQILRLWEQTLDALTNDPQSLVGTLDWVTKKYMLENAPHDSSWLSLKKLDLKYHELSPAGYHRVLTEHVEVPSWVTPEEIERATRLPPLHTPASMRGRLIREFLGGDEPLAVNWRMVRVGRGVGSRTFRLSDFQPEWVENERRDRESQASDPQRWADDVDGSTE